MLSALTDELVIVKSNHDEFLDRYLKRGDFPKDPLNARFAAKIFLEYLDKKDPLRARNNFV